MLLKITARAAVVLALILGVAAGAHAYVLRGDNNYVASGRTIDDDLYVSGKNIQIDGTVNGDVYAAGSNLNIRGTVNGDVIAAGQDVTIGGTVRGSVRAAGSNLRLAGVKTGGSVTLLGQNITVDSGSNIAGGLQFGGSNVRVADSIGRGVAGYGGLVTLAGAIGKDAAISAGTLNLDSSARVGGNLIYNVSDKLNKSQGATVGGQTRAVENTGVRDQDDKKATVAAAIWGLLALLATGSFLLWLAPTAFTASAGALSSQPAKSLGWGLLIALLALPVLILMMVTVLGLPLALLGAAGLAAAFYLTKYVVALAVGDLLSRRAGWKANPYADAFIGLILITLLEFVPVLGPIVRLAVALLGLGGMFIYLRRRVGSRGAAVKAA